MKRINRQELTKLLQELIPHLNHRRGCAEEMTSHGEPCWCGIKFNHVLADRGEKLLKDRVQEMIEKLQS